MPLLPEIKVITDHEKYRLAIQVGERSIGLVGHPLGDLLFLEALEYPDIEFQEIGTHTSFRVHNPIEGLQFISIHFRRGIDELKSHFDLGKAKEFYKNLIGDLPELAKELNRNSLLEKVEMIHGLTALSANWGKRHGFSTKIYTSDQNLLEIHEATMAERPSPGDTSKLSPLHIFSFDVEGFIDKYFPLT